MRARASLGLSVFGVQIIKLPPDSGEIHPLHDPEEIPSPDAESSAIDDGTVARG